MSKVDEKFEIELNAMKYNVHANSPYNDGWTQDHFKGDLVAKKLPAL